MTIEPTDGETKRAHDVCHARGSDAPRAEESRCRFYDLAARLNGVLPRTAHGSPWPPLPSGVDVKLFAERTIEQARRHEASQLRQRAGALADLVAKPRPRLGKRVCDCLGDDQRVVASLEARVDASTHAFAGRDVVVDALCCLRRILVEARLHESRLDEQGSDSEGSNFVVE